MKLCSESSGGEGEEDSWFDSWSEEDEDDEIIPTEEDAIQGDQHGLALI